MWESEPRTGEVAAICGRSGRYAARDLDLPFAGPFADRRLRFSHSCSAALMRDCQPGPSSRNAATMSGSSRMVVETFGAADGRRPRRTFAALNFSAHSGRRTIASRKLAGEPLPVGESDERTP